MRSRAPKASDHGTQRTSICSELCPVQSGLWAKLTSCKSGHGGTWNTTVRILQLAKTWPWSLHPTGALFTMTDLPSQDLCHAYPKAWPQITKELQSQTAAPPSVLTHIPRTSPSVASPVLTGALAPSESLSPSKNSVHTFSLLTHFHCFPST